MLKRELSFCSKFIRGATFAAIVVRALFYYQIEKSTQWYDLQGWGLSKFHLIHLSIAGEYLIAMIVSGIFKEMDNAIVQEAAQHIFEPLFAPLCTFVACAIPARKAQEHGVVYPASAFIMIVFKGINEVLNHGVMFENIVPNLTMYLGVKALASKNDKVPITPFVVNACAAMGLTIIRTYQPMRQVVSELFVPALSAAMTTLALDRIMQNYFPSYQS